MNYSLIAAAIIAATTTSASTQFANISIQDKNALQQELDAWKASSAGEEAATNGFLPKFTIDGRDALLERFFNAKQTIATLQAANPEATFGNTPFTLLTEAEFASYVGRSAGKKSHFQLDAVTATEHDLNSVEVDDVAAKGTDWTTSGCVAPVKNQGQCGSCWAFSATASVESAYCMKNGTKKITLFSDQQLTSCVKSAGDGCNGGDETAALNWVKSQGKICLASGYPYTSGGSGQNGVCKTNCQSVPVKITSVVRVGGGEKGLQSALGGRPVTVAVTAGNSVWQHYKGGVISTCGSTSAQLDHAVFAVGYDGSSYKVKNSWGTSWGSSGYINIKASSSSGSGICKLASEPSYAQM